MERMKAQLCRPLARGCVSHPTPSAKPTFDFYFGSRQHSTWEGAEKPHSSSPATSGAGALRRGGGSWDPEDPTQPSSGTRLQGRGACGARVGLGAKERRPPKNEGSSFLSH